MIILVSLIITLIGLLFWTKNRIVTMFAIGFAAAFIAFALLLEYVAR